MEGEARQAARRASAANELVRAQRELEAAGPGDQETMTAKRDSLVQAYYAASDSEKGQLAEVTEKTAEINYIVVGKERR